MKNLVGGNSFVELKSIFERVERINEELKNGNADKAEIFKDAKSSGFDVAAIKALIKERAKDSQDLQRDAELDAVVDIYRAALSGQKSVDTLSSLNSVAAIGLYPNSDPTRGRVSEIHDPEIDEIVAQEQVVA